MHDMPTLISKLRGLAHPNSIRKNFPSYITKIHFPFFKNLDKGTEIYFDFPLTVFVGQNGCGKSSALQALSGCPDGKSVGNFWFNTATDPIPESTEGLSPSFWFEYYNEKARQDVQILKYRTRYEKGGRVNPDYWEPARPLPRYGMKPFPSKDIPGKLKTRWEGLKKDVLYLDFRAALSAFDKYFYFADDPRKKVLKSKQDFLRHHSANLQQVFDGSIAVKYKKVRNQEKKRALNHKLSILPEPELKAICSILGKSYVSAKYLQHSFYKQEGISVRFESKRPDNSQLDYTEAYAGSGEMSVVTLVHQVFNARDNSLILLDEPEVSLHPGAQKKMLKFLLEQIQIKKHQIVLCTHSSALVEELPDTAIKLFASTPDGYFKVYPKTNPILAFSHIGQTVSSKIKIIVEDEAAKQLVDKIISSHPGWADIYDVDFHPGGAEDIFKEAVAFSRVKETRRFFLLDGDKKSGLPIDLGNIGERLLDDKIFEITGIKVKGFQFVADSGGETSAQLIGEKKTYLEYLNRQFRFLPGVFPEDIIISASTASDKPEWENQEASGKDSKKALEEWVYGKVGSSTSTDISTYRKELLNSIDLKHEHIEEIISILQGLQR